MKQLVNVVMLPTEKAINNGIVRSTHQPKDFRIANRGHHGNKIFDVGFEHSTKEWQPMFLYFTSTEKIKQNFRGLAIVTVKDDPRIHYLVDVIVTENNQIYTKGDRKFSFLFSDVHPVVATNDHSLYSQSESILNLIPQRFIEKFVKTQGKIKEAYIQTYSDSGNAMTRSDGTVIVSPAKTYTSNDLPIEAIMNVIKYCEDKQIYDKLGYYGDFYYKLKNWSNKYHE